jgi:hypothetical protein
VPSWLDTGKSLSFQGQMSIQVQGASLMNTPSALQMTYVDVGLKRYPFNFGKCSFGSEKYRVN